MKLVAGAIGLAVLLQAGARTGSEPFRWMRSVEVGAGSFAGHGFGRACAVLEGRVYAHAEPALADVRLFAGKDARLFAGDGVGKEVPYALTMSEAAVTEDGEAAVLNEGGKGGQAVFDLRMPERPYSEVRLHMDAVDFVATATVTGLRALGDRQPTALGKFTLFDLTAEKLGRSTRLGLSESTFPFLHVDLAVRGATGPDEQGKASLAAASLVTGAEVPPSREAQTLYTEVAETGQMVQRGRESVAEFEVPAHVPVERVSFVLAPGFATNFSRRVRVRAQAEKANGNETPSSEELTGEISRVRLTQGGVAIRESSLSVPAILGSDGQSAAKVEVAVENGDDPPVGISAVRLEMRQRKLCFDAAGAPVEMYYGADGVKAPVYDYSRSFSPAAEVGVAQLGPERANPEFVARVEARPFMERHREMLWVGLVGVVLGGVGWRLGRRGRV